MDGKGDEFTGETPRSLSPLPEQTVTDSALKSPVVSGSVCGNYMLCEALLAWKLF